MDQAVSIPAVDTSWKNLYKIGGVAALLAGIIFRRNLGVEIALFSAQKQPDNIAGWFQLLQSRRLLGLAYLSVFDILNYTLVALMFLALYAVLHRVRQNSAVTPATLGLLGIGVYFASNTAFSLLALSEQYAAAATEAEKSLLLAAGQALLALNRFGISGAHPGSGGYLSLLLVAAAGMTFSISMLRCGEFKKAAAYLGILANGLDLAYCAAFLFAPRSIAGLLAILFIPAAGLFFMIWHILVGWSLLRLARRADGTKI